MYFGALLGEVFSFLGERERLCTLNIKTDLWYKLGGVILCSLAQRLCNSYGTWMLLPIHVLQVVLFLRGMDRYTIWCTRHNHFSLFQVRSLDCLWFSKSSYVTWITSILNGKFISEGFSSPWEMLSFPALLTTLPFTAEAWWNSRESNFELKQTLGV